MLAENEIIEQNNDKTEFEPKKGSENKADQEASGTSNIAKWKLNMLMAIFVILTSTRYITTKLIDEAVVYDENGEVVEYRHPMLQAMFGYLGEYVVAVVMWLYYIKKEPVQLEHSGQISVYTLALPALCDFFENMCMIFGMTQIFPSLVTMSRALVLPITAVLSRWLIRKYFNW